MARKVFFSFHYKSDNSRPHKFGISVRSKATCRVPTTTGNPSQREGDAAIKQWIDGQLSGRSCAIVLVGSATAGRKWINYEIEKAWNDGKGVVGIHIHRLKNLAGEQAMKRNNPFSGFTVGENKTPLSSIVKLYDQTYSDSKLAYGHIKDNIADWIEEAIAIRNKY